MSVRTLWIQPENAVLTHKPDDTKDFQISGLKRKLLYNRSKLQYKWLSSLPCDPANRMLSNVSTLEKYMRSNLWQAPMRES